MAGTIIHYGADDCRRTQVLKSEGFSILRCDSIAQLHSFLTMPLGADAVTMEENAGELPYQALSVVRSSTTARLILFKKNDKPDIPDEMNFDLVIPGFTPPQEWVHKISALLANSRSH